MDSSFEAMKRALAYKLQRPLSEWRDWRPLEARLRADEQLCTRLAQALAEPLVEIIRCGLAHSTNLDANSDVKWQRWIQLVTHLKSQGELPNAIIHKGATFLAEELAAQGRAPVDFSAAPPLPAQTPPAPTRTRAPTPPPSPAPVPCSHPQPASTPPATPGSPAPAMNPNPPSGAPQWKYLPLPDDPDKHEESDARTGHSAEGWPIVGARVRGKKHKHEGTNSDDWFEFATTGAWTVLTVSDGAGSKKFSRIGARVSCQAAAQSLQANLVSHRLAERASIEEWQRDLGGSGDLAILGTDIQAVQEALHQAMQAGLDSVIAACDERVGRPEYEQVLGARLELNDLAATLLVAVHTTVPLDGDVYSLVLACQIGDGMTAAVLPRGDLRLLGEADSGGYSGETEFLTSRGKLELENLLRKTRFFFGRMQALMLMTDGVADDYFPNDPGLLRLYGDLVFNRLLERAETPPDEPVGDTGAGPYLSRLSYSDARGTHEVPIRSVGDYATHLGLPLKAVLADPMQLWAAGRGDPIQAGPAADRLRTWLDAYQVRGSFDDRTLLVLHRETLA